MIRSRLLLIQVAAATLACACLSGCGLITRKAPPPRPLISEGHLVSPEPAAFSWEHGQLSAAGTSSDVPLAAGGIPQQAFAARQSAKSSAVHNLELQVRQLPVNEDATIGTVMDLALSIQRGVKLAMQRVHVVEETPLSDGRYEVQVTLPLATIAEVLRQNYILPGEPLPEIPLNDDSGFGPHA